MAIFAKQLHHNLSQGPKYASTWLWISWSNYCGDCVHLTKLYHFLFLHLSKVWSMLYHGSARRVQNKNTTLSFHLLFWHFLLFFIIKFVFYHSHFFFDKVSNSHNRILTNQKQVTDYRFLIGIFRTLPNIYNEAFRKYVYC